MGGCRAALAAERIGEEALVPLHPRAVYSRWVNFRPGDGEVVHLNPPRFSWRYSPEGFSGDNRSFVFQIAPTPEFKDPAVNVRTKFNFYNTIPALRGRKKWYWRVGYDVGTNQEKWSKTFSFTIADDAIVWDRSALAPEKLKLHEHPRILFTKETLPEIRKLAQTNEASHAALEYMRRVADAALRSSWWRDFPQNDRERAPVPYIKIAHDLVVVAFVWLMTGEEKYAGVKERAVTFASYPKGGRSSPEGAGGESAEDSTQNNEFLALLFDWLYPVLSEKQRQIMVRSLEWRTDHIINNFAWRRRGRVTGASLSTECTSHGFESSMDTAPAGLALYEHSPVGQQCFELMLNYLIGVTNGFGPDEAWNEGPGYGTSKLKWLMHATIYYDTALPQAHLGLNPYYRAVGDFFCRITPVGLKHSPWGNGSASEGYYRGNRINTFRKLAFLCGEGRFLRNWRESGGRLFSKSRPWIEYVLPYYYKEPREQLERDTVRLFPIAGWVMAASHPPSSAKDFSRAVGIIFQSRPRGGYSHSFNSDNSFQIYAYGEQVNHGGGSTVNRDAYAYHTMSHTTILVDGLGQAQPSGPPLYPYYSRIVGFKRGKDYVYFAGDATPAYPRKPGKYGRWGLPLSDIYRKRAVGHLRRFVRHVLFVKNRYFVVFDDLAASKPATFTWLYHILPEKPFDFDERSFTVTYGVGNVRVKLRQIAYPQQLILDDRRGLEAMVNPFTGEDYREYRKPGPLPAHNLWISNKAPAGEFHFLTVVYPYRASEGEPKIRRIDDWTVEVDGDVISFNPQYKGPADIVVDVPAFRPTSLPQ